MVHFSTYLLVVINVRRKKLYEKISDIPISYFIKFISAFNQTFETPIKFIRQVNFINCFLDKHYFDLFFYLFRTLSDHTAVFSLSERILFLSKLIGMEGYDINWWRGICSFHDMFLLKTLKLILRVFLRKRLVLRFLLLN